MGDIFSALADATCGDFNLYYLLPRPCRRWVFNDPQNKTNGGAPGGGGFLHANNWASLLFQLLLLVGWSLFNVVLVFFYPLSPVEYGPDWNFQNIMLPVYQFTTIFSWIFYLRFVFPRGFMNFKGQLIVSGITFLLALENNIRTSKLYEEPLDHFNLFNLLEERPVSFPIPFSILLTTLPSMATCLIFPSGFAIADNRWTTRHKCAIKVVFWLSVATISAFIWGISMRKLEGKNVAQIVLSAIYGLIKFVFKMLLMSSLTQKAVPTKFIIAGYAVDMIFARVHAATIPFIESDLTLFLSLFLGEILPHLWRLLIMPDRFTLWFQGTVYWYCFGIVTRKKEVLDDPRNARFFNSNNQWWIRKYLPRPFGVSIPHMCALSLKAQEDPHRIYENAHWIDRLMFHYVDGTGTIAISLLVRIHSIVCVWVAKSIAVNDHMYERYTNIDMKVWGFELAISRAFLLILILSFWLMFVDLYFLLSVREPRTGKRLNLKMILCYIFTKGNNLCFFVAWFILTGNLMVASFIDHFGFDFTFENQTRLWWKPSASSPFQEV